MTVMQQIRIGPDFFLKERDNAYSDFSRAFWRENIQNSVDAGSTEIHIESVLLDAAENIYSIQVNDNGCGMDRNTLENVFFCLGETTKKTADSIGGFARARIMTHFASLNYTIQTQDNLVKGQGAEYSIESYPFYSGCKMGFCIKAISKYGRNIEMTETLKQYLSSCQLSCKVFINGEQFTNWSYKRQATKKLNLGTVYVNKSQKENIIIVRVNGVTMFDMGTDCPYRIIIEVDPAISRKALSSSRDNLMSEYSSQWDTFIRELSRDADKTLRNYDEEKVSILGRNITMSRAKMTKEESVATATFVSPLTPDSYSMTIPFDLYFANGRKIPFSFVVYENVSELTEHKTEYKKQAKAYNAENWYKSGSLTNTNKAKLLMAWTSICEDIMQIFCDKYKTVAIGWMPGFCFSSARAMLRRDNDLRTILLNPLTTEGKNKFKLTNKDHVNELISLAIHEVCHVGVTGHDSSFAAIQTDMTHATIPHINSIKKKLKEQLKKIDMYAFGQ